MIRPATRSKRTSTRAISKSAEHYAPERKSRHDAADDERFLTGGGIRSPELIEHAGLLQRDFPHELRADDLANIKAFHLQRLLLVGCAHDFSGGSVCCFRPGGSPSSISCDNRISAAYPMGRGPRVQRSCWRLSIGPSADHIRAARLRLLLRHI